MKSSYKLKIFFVVVFFFCAVWMLIFIMRAKQRSKDYESVAEKTKASPEIVIPPYTMTLCPECGEETRYDEYIEVPGLPNMRKCPKCSKNIPTLMLKANAIYAIENQNQ